MKPSHSISTLVATTIITGVFLSGCTQSDLPAEVKETTTSTKMETPEVETQTPVIITPTQTTTTETEQSTQTTQSVSTLQDGAYAESVSYESPAGNENITFNFTVKDMTVVDIAQTSDATNKMSQKFQGLFLSGIKEEIIGKKIDTLGNFDNVNGSSLTAGAFNKALGKLKNK